MKDFILSKTSDIISTSSNNPITEKEKRKDKILNFGYVYDRIINNYIITHPSTHRKIDSIIEKNNYYKKRFYQIKSSRFASQDKNIRTLFFVWQDDGYCYNLLKNDNCKIGFVLQKDSMYENEKESKTYRDKSISKYQEAINKKTVKLQDIKNKLENTPIFKQTPQMPLQMPSQTSL